MTFEITKDKHLTRRGDCVIAVNATKAPVDLSAEFKNLCRHENSRITMRLEVNGVTDLIQGWGSPKLALTHSSEMVGRKSSFISDRTVMIAANKAAVDIKRNLVEALRSPNTRLLIQFVVEV